MKFLHNPLPRDGDKSFAFPIQCFMLKVVGAWPLMDKNDSTTTFTSTLFSKNQNKGISNDVTIHSGGLGASSNNISTTIAGFIYLAWSHTIIILIALTCLAQSSFVYFAWGDILTVTECGCTVIMGLHNLLRLIHLSFHRKALKKLNTEFVRNIWISRFVL